MPTYRTATEEDFPTLAAMYARLNAYFYEVGYRLPRPENVGEVWLDSFRRTLGRFSQVFVAEVDGELLGFALGRIKRLPPHMGGLTVGELSDVWVEPQARGQGVGRQLCRALLDWLRARQVHSVEVQVLRDNHAAWRVYERLGFREEFRAGRLLWEEYGEG